MERWNSWWTQLRKGVTDSSGQGGRFISELLRSWTGLGMIMGHRIHTTQMKGPQEDKEEGAFRLSCLFGHLHPIWECPVQVPLALPRILLPANAKCGKAVQDGHRAWAPAPMET